METGKIQEHRIRAKSYFSSETPVHIITNQDSWINGYIREEPEEFFFWVMDKEGDVKVHYIDIYLFEDYRGSISKLRPFTPSATSRGDAFAKDAVILGTSNSSNNGVRGAKTSHDPHNQKGSGNRGDKNGKV